MKYLLYKTTGGWVMENLTTPQIPRSFAKASDARDFARASGGTVRRDKNCDTETLT